MKHVLFFIRITCRINDIFCVERHKKEIVVINKAQVTLRDDMILLFIVISLMFSRY
jgi:hypothetical protein